MPKRKTHKPKISYNINKIIGDLKGTQYYLEDYLEKHGISLLYQDKIRQQVGNEIDQCEVCDTWDELGEMTQGHCDRCWEDSEENQDNSYTED